MFSSRTVNNIIDLTGDDHGAITPKKATPKRTPTAAMAASPKSKKKKLGSSFMWSPFKQLEAKDENHAVVLFDCFENATAPLSDVSHSPVAAAGNYRERDIFSCHMEGKPVPLPRFRHFNNGMWNAAKKKRDEFARVAKEQMPVVTRAGPHFPEGTPVSLQIWFFLRRPDSDFVGRKRAPGNLKPSAYKQTLVSCTPDIDNLAKFVMDALNNTACDCQSSFAAA